MITTLLDGHDADSGFGVMGVTADADGNLFLAQAYVAICVPAWLFGVVLSRAVVPLAVL